MSLIRQMALLLAAVVAVAMGGSVVMVSWTARDALQAQCLVRDGDAATMLASVMSHLQGDKARMAATLTGQFEAGRYRRIRLSGADGEVLFDREELADLGTAPSWLVSALPITIPLVQARVDMGSNVFGRIEIESHPAWAYGALWSGLVRTAAWLSAVGLLALGISSLAVRRWRAELAAVIAQAQALEEGRYIEVAEPRALELRLLVAGMNATVRRLHALFDSHANQVEALRKRAQVDALTGLSNRRHFLAQLERVLVVKSETVPGKDAPRRGALLILRLAQLGVLNGRLGHEAVDRLLGSMGDVLLAYPHRVEGAFAGRLNGGDLALYLPVNGLARETAEAVRATLRAALGATDTGADVAIGGIDRLATGVVSDALAGADLALARAESEGGFAVDVEDAAEEAPPGEGGWRQQISQALAAGRVDLAEFPVVDANGSVLHLECPLRIQLTVGGPFVAAAQWLPMAARGRLTQKVDLTATSLALLAIARDRRARCVHVAAVSLSDPGFAHDIARLLSGAPAAARLLSIEVGEAVAAHDQRWREAARRWRPFGVSLGLENAGGSLHALVDAHGWGLNYLKIDGRFLRGLSQDVDLAEYARQVVATARGIGLAVYAEGIDDALDLERLRQIGFDGATGPAVSVAR